MKKRYYIYTVKVFLTTIFLAIAALPAISQYYYKDLVTIQQTNETFRTYKSNKVNKVTLNSFQGNNPVTEGFICEQSVNLARNQVITYTKTLDLGESFLTATYQSQGLLVRTIDSSSESVSFSSYKYDASDHLIAIQQSTHATDNSSSLTESHYWQYSASGKPVKMLRVKNNNDTTFVNFITDEKGNVIEEDITGKMVKGQKIYYYYDAKNRLTDVVQYRQKAKRLLPDYMFEYEETGELSTMTIVPEGSTDYQKYFYKYDENGLKVIEFCYNKRNELLGKVEYKYGLGK